MTAPEKRLRLDKSKPHSTIHGQRHPGDPFLQARFQQDGIHYDGQGLHIEELINDDKTRALVDRRLKRQTKAAAPKPEGAGAGDDDDDGADNTAPSDVNLEAWLRGEAKYEWFAITKAVAERYKVRKTKQVDVVDLLVNEEKIIPIDQLDPNLAAQLKQQS